MVNYAVQDMFPAARLKFLIGYPKGATVENSDNKIRYQLPNIISSSLIVSLVSVARYTNVLLPESGESDTNVKI